MRSISLPEQRGDDPQETEDRNRGEHSYPDEIQIVALTAWTGNPAKYYRNDYYGVGHLATCPRFDEKAFTAFRDAYRDHGPEGVPGSSNKPGTGPGA